MLDTVYYKRIRDHKALSTIMMMMTMRVMIITMMIMTMTMKMMVVVMTLWLWSLDHTPPKSNNILVDSGRGVICIFKFRILGVCFQEGKCACTY